jgi:hypothetical protein
MVAKRKTPPAYIKRPPYIYTHTLTSTPLIHTHPTVYNRLAAIYYIPLIHIGGTHHHTPVIYDGERERGPYIYISGGKEREGPRVPIYIHYPLDTGLPARGYVESRDLQVELLDGLLAQFVSIGGVVVPCHSKTPAEAKIKAKLEILVSITEPPRAGLGPEPATARARLSEPQAASEATLPVPGCRKVPTASAEAGASCSASCARRPRPAGGRRGHGPGQGGRGSKLPQIALLRRV